MEPWRNMKGTSALFRLVILSVALLVHVATACMFKATESNTNLDKGSFMWEEENNERNSTSMCGKFFNCQIFNCSDRSHFTVSCDYCYLTGCGEGNSSWRFFVHIDEADQHRVCLGTLVTSNLMVTSHRCVTKGGHLNIFDTWKKSGSSNVVDKDMIKVSKEIAPGGLMWRVEEVVYNPHYIISVSTGNFPDDDVLLFKITISNHGTTLWQEKMLPVCLPQPGNIQLDDVLYRNATFFSINKREEVARRLLRNETQHGDEMMSEEVVIVKASDCILETLQGDQFVDASTHTLCVRLRFTTPVRRSLAQVSWHNLLLKNNCNNLVCALIAAY